MTRQARGQHPVYIFEAAPAGAAVSIFRAGIKIMADGLVTLKTYDVLYAAGVCFRRPVRDFEHFFQETADHAVSFQDKFRLPRAGIGKMDGSVFALGQKALALQRLSGITRAGFAFAHARRYIAYAYGVSGSELAYAVDGF
jgi:hypothetical protein